MTACFVAVADDVFGLGRLAPGQAPLETGRETRPAPAAQARGRDLGQDGFGGHFAQGLGQGLVAVGGDILLDLLGIDAAAVAKDDEPLALEEIDVRHPGHGRPSGLGDVHMLGHRTALEQVLLDEVGDVGRGQPLIEDVVRLDEDDGALLAEAVAAGGHDEHLVGQTPPGDLLPEGLFELEGAAGDAAGPGADEDVGPVPLHGVPSSVPSFFGEAAGLPRHGRDPRTPSALASLIWP